MQGTIEETALGRDQLLSLVESGNRLNSKLGLDAVLRSVLEVACRITNSTAGSVILHDPKFDDLYFAAATGPVADELPSIRIPPGQGKAGRVFADRTPLLENDLDAQRGHYKAVDEQTEFRTVSMVCAPLLYQDVCYGVVQILNKANGTEPYVDLDLELLEHVATQSSIAIHNAKQFEHILASSGLHALPEVRSDLVTFLTDPSRPAKNERLTILFADMRGFTQLTTNLGDAEEIQDMLSEFVGMLADAVLQNHGIANKFLGDGVLGIFRDGAGAINALRTAFDILGRFDRMLTRWSKRTSVSLRFLDVGVGIASGKVIIGTLGNEDLREFTVMGTPVILASALESHARGGKRVLCDLLTFENAREIVELHEGPMKFELHKSDQQALPEFEIFEIKSLRSERGADGVFVSHHHEDVDLITQTIVKPLKDLGFEVFYSDDSLDPGADFAERIGKALENAAWFIVAVTKGATKSRWVREEVRFALEADHLEGRVLAVEIDESAADTIDWRLARRQHIDARGEQRDEILAAAFGRLRDISRSGSSEVPKAPEV